MSRVGLVPSLVLLAALLGGCAALPQFLRPGGEALARADRLADAGDYEAALAAYDDYLTGHADAGEAPRARTSRDALRAVLGARAAAARLGEELAALQAALGAREGELARTREDLGRHAAELARLRQELARRQAELEQLKKIDERLSGQRRRR
ncbi:MAG TPA: hypothetical protein DDZ42_14135 [Candidatus Rokubacteria bacterium]|nr:MAG: hypothetical protein A2050_15850 [Candidatus Rokubacteria bacterium GWA2_73_35]HBH03035.1 hypothetical protein [Candidatus Rokubacteria bacterium]